MLVVSSSRCEYEWVVSGVHDGPKIGCDTGCILGPAWVSPTALQPATRGLVTSNAVPSVISIFPMMRSFGVFAKESTFMRLSGASGVGHARRRRDNRRIRRIRCAPWVHVHKKQTSFEKVHGSKAPQKLPSAKPSVARQGANADAGVGPQELLVVSLREGTDVLVLACLSVCCVSPNRKEGVSLA